MPLVYGISATSSFGGGNPLDRLAHLVLPATVLAFGYVAIWSRFTRSSMLEVLSNDYIRTAHAKGMGARRVAENTPIELKAARDTESQARARYQAGLATIVDVAEAQGLLVQAEGEDRSALGRIVPDSGLDLFVHAASGGHAEENQARADARKNACGDP